MDRELDPIKVRPTEGTMVRFPDPPYQFLDVNGEKVPLSAYWRRRLVNGDVVIMDEEVETAVAPGTTRESGAVKGSRKEG